MTIDDLRARFPLCGFSLYALEPGGDVTLEIVAPDQTIYEFKAGSEAAACLLALPSDEPAAEPEPINAFE